MISSFESFVDNHYANGCLTLISDTNNRVYRLDGDQGPVAIKHITDPDIPLPYLATVNNTLGQQIPTQRIIEVHLATNQQPYDVVVSEFIDGENLSSALRRHTIETSVVSGFLVEFIDAMLEIPPHCDGYGLFKNNAPMFTTRTEFVEHYANRYWGRARPFFDSDVQDLVDSWVAGGLAGLIIDEHPDAMIAIDANLKNFIVTPQGSITVLNVPIIANSTITHGLAAIAVHLRHLPVRDQFIHTALNRFPEARPELLAHYELWNMLGIVSFFAVREPHSPNRWQSFSSPKPVRQDFAEMARTLLA